jgi:hypothetical protein
VALAFSAGGTGDYIEAASAPAVSGAFTLSALVLVPATPDAGTFFGLGQSASTNYVALGTDDFGQIFFETSPSAVDAFSTANANLGAWNHVAGVQSSTTSRVVYLNGVAGTPNTQSSNPSGMDRVS